MANDYHPVAPSSAEEVLRSAQQEFLRVNHHCISPWMYTPRQIQQRNHALFLQEFDRAQRDLHRWRKL